MLTCVFWPPLREKRYTGDFAHLAHLITGAEGAVP